MKTFLAHLNTPWMNENLPSTFKYSLNQWNPSYYMQIQYFSQPIKTFLHTIITSTNENLPIICKSSPEPIKTFLLYVNTLLNQWKTFLSHQPMKTFILHANTPLNQWKPSHYMQIVLSTNENLPIMFLWVIANKN